MHKSSQWNYYYSLLWKTYINKNKTLPNDFKKEPNFMNKFVNLIKHLLMNEVELVAFTILIDKIGWKHKKIDCWIYLTILGIYSKKLVVYYYSNNYFEFVIFYF